MIQHLETRTARPAGYLIPGAPSSENLPAPVSGAQTTALADTYVNPSSSRPNTIAHRPRGRFFVGLILLACVVAIAWSVWQVLFRYKAHGMIVGTVVEVAASREGTVTAVHVVAGQRLAAGDALFEIDARDLDLEREALVQELEVARAELSATEADLSLRRAVQLERYQEAATELLEAKADLTGQRAELEGLRAELPLKREMRARGIPELTVEKLEIQMEGQAARVEQEVEALDQMAQRVDTLGTLPDPGIGVLEPFRARIGLIEGQIERLDERIARSAIVSPVDGYVLEVLHEPGEYCQASDALITVLDRDSLGIRMYLRQKEAGLFAAGDLVEVMTEPEHRALRCTVDRLDHQLAAAPESIQRHYRASEVLLPVHLQPDWEDEGWASARLHQTVMLERHLSEVADQAARKGRELLTASEGAVRSLAGK